jgi:hypothetical protein
VPPKKSKQRGGRKKKTKVQNMNNCVLAGSQRHWAGPGSILNFWMFELKLQKNFHPSIHPSKRDSNVDFEAFGSCLQVKTMVTL